MVKEEAPEWAIAVGVAGVLLLVATLGLIAAGGWTWFARLLESAAPAWVQAVGSLIAIGVAIAVPAGQFKRESLRRSREEAAHRARQVGVHVAIAERAMGALQRAESHVARAVGWDDDWSSTLSLVDEADLEVARLGQLPFQDLPSYEEVRTAYNLLDALREASAEMRQLAKHRDEAFSVPIARRQAFTFALGKAQISYSTLANQYIAEITHAQARKATN